MSLHTLLLALLQGITEFLPISSSAHLILLPLIMNVRDQGVLIDIAAHGGTLLAVMLYFRKDMKQLFNGLMDIIRPQKSAARQEFLMLVIATLPIVFIGGLMFVADFTGDLRTPLLIAATTIIFGLLLGTSDRKAVTHDNVTPYRALIIGVAQCFAILPGTSRSGVTMTAARYLGMSREGAARFSMRLSIPTILMAVAAASASLVETGIPTVQSEAVSVAAVSFLTALTTIHLLLKCIEKIGFMPFVIYRLILGGGILVISYIH